MDDSVLMSAYLASHRHGLGLEKVAFCLRVALWLEVARYKVRTSRRHGGEAAVAKLLKTPVSGPHGDEFSYTSFTSRPPRLGLLRQMAQHGHEAREDILELFPGCLGNASVHSAAGAQTGTCTAFRLPEFNFDIDVGHFLDWRGSHELSVLGDPPIRHADSSHMMKGTVTARSTFDVGDRAFLLLYCLLNARLEMGQVWPARVLYAPHGSISGIPTTDYTFADLRRFANRARFLTNLHVSTAQQACLELPLNKLDELATASSSSSVGCVVEYIERFKAERDGGRTKLQMGAEATPGAIRLLAPEDKRKKASTTAIRGKGKKAKIARRKLKKKEKKEQLAAQERETKLNEEAPKTGEATSELSAREAGAVTATTGAKSRRWAKVRGTGALPRFSSKSSGGVAASVSASPVAAAAAVAGIGSRALQDRDRRMSFPPSSPGLLPFQADPRLIRFEQLTSG